MILNLTHSSSSLVAEVVAVHMYACFPLCCVLHDETVTHQSKCYVTCSSGTCGLTDDVPLSELNELAPMMDHNDDLPHILPVVVVEAGAIMLSLTQDC